MKLSDVKRSIDMSERVREDMFPHDYSCRKKRTCQFPKFDFPNSGRTVHKDEDYISDFDMRAVGKYSGVELIIEFDEDDLVVTYKTIDDFIKDIKYYGVYDPYGPCLMGVYIYDRESHQWLCNQNGCILSVVGHKLMFLNPAEVSLYNHKNCEYVEGITTIHQLCEFLTILDLCWWTRTDS